MWKPPRAFESQALISKGATFFKLEQSDIRTSDNDAEKEKEE